MIANRYLDLFNCNKLCQISLDITNSYHCWVNSGRPSEIIGNPLNINYTRTKRIISKILATISRDYENNKMLNTVQLDEIYIIGFWKLLKKPSEFNTCRSSTTAILEG